ncbi:MAG: aminoacyl-tRNA hydrolase [Patescibacteria group bacterium]
MKIIIGLGNPGKDYQKTRHNAGFMVVDALCEKFKEYGVSDWSLSKKFNAEVSEVKIKDENILLVKPMTFMNRSGETAHLIMRFYKLPPKDLIIIHDDKDLKLGEIKIQTDRGDAGHNGVKSVIEHLGTKDFTRVRVGIASEEEKKMSDTSKFVLGKFGIREKKRFNEAARRTVEEIKKVIKN